MVALLVGGGFFFMLHSRLLHFRYFGHSFNLLRGKYNDQSGTDGDISHYQALALATALAGTVGLGNITGVAVAITTGGPGAVFWMWVTAIVGIPLGLASSGEHFFFDFMLGLILAVLVLSVALGKINPVSAVAAKVVPAMVLFYFAITAALLIMYAGEIPAMVRLIFVDAFTGEAVLGGALGAIILIGVQRGAFSNEAGIGTELLAHGAAKTSEPTRAGLVAMVGPIIDTLIVCTCTAIALLVTGVWDDGAEGITLTTMAYQQAFPGFGAYFLLAMVFVLSFTTALTYWYYGTKCMGFLFGTARVKLYMWIYMGLIAVKCFKLIRAKIRLRH